MCILLLHVLIFKVFCFLQLIYFLLSWEKLNNLISNRVLATSLLVSFRQKQNVLFPQVVCFKVVSPDIFLMLSHFSFNFPVTPLAASPFPLCIALWDKSVAHVFQEDTSLCELSPTKSKACLQFICSMEQSSSSNLMVRSDGHCQVVESISKFITRKLLSNDQ